MPSAMEIPRHYRCHFDARCSRVVQRDVQSDQQSRVPEQRYFCLQVLRECIEKCEDLGIKVVELLEVPPPTIGPLLFWGKHGKP